MVVLGSAFFDRTVKGKRSAFEISYKLKRERRLMSKLFSSRLITKRDIIGLVQMVGDYATGEAVDSKVESVPNGLVESSCNTSVITCRAE
jgi:hypothetical protein